MSLASSPRYVTQFSAKYEEARAIYRALPSPLSLSSVVSHAYLEQTETLDEAPRALTHPFRSVLLLSLLASRAGRSFAGFALHLNTQFT